MSICELGYDAFCRSFFEIAQAESCGLAQRFGDSKRDEVSVPAAPALSTVH